MSYCHHYNQNTNIYNEWNKKTDVAAAINMNNDDNQKNSIYNELNTKKDEAADININNNNNQNHSRTIYNVWNTKNSLNQIQAQKHSYRQHHMNQLTTQ